MTEVEVRTQTQIDQFDSLYKNNEILKLRENFEKTFSDYFYENNYLECPPLPPIAEEDSSIFFVGSTINAFKPMLVSGGFPEKDFKYNGYYIFQDCLRTGAIRNILDPSWIPFGQAHFKMAGIVSVPHRLEEVLKEFIEFNFKIGIDRDRTKIKSTKTDSQLGSIDSFIDLNIEYDQEPEAFYDWVYGTEKLTGKGLTISIFNEGLNDWLDVGNVVLLHNENNEEIGIEFGYGYEFFLSAALGIKNPLELSKVSEIFNVKEGLSTKYYYLLETVATMKTIGLEVSRKGLGHIYSKYLRALEFAGEQFDKSIPDIFSDLDKYLQNIYHLDLQLSEEMNYLKVHKGKKENFLELLRQIKQYQEDILLGKTPKQVFADPSRTIQKYLRKNGIGKEESNYIINKLT